MYKCLRKIVCQNSHLLEKSRRLCYIKGRKWVKTVDKDINNEHDLGYKHILSHKKNFIDFLKSFVKKEWVNLIEEENLVLIDKEFILENFRASIKGRF